MSKCMFCEEQMDMPIACSECWFNITDENVSTMTVFGLSGSNNDYESLILLREWTGLGEQI